MGTADTVALFHNAVPLLQMLGRQCRMRDSSLQSQYVAQLDDMAGMGPVSSGDEEQHKVPKQGILADSRVLLDTLALS